MIKKVPKVLPHLFMMVGSLWFLVLLLYQPGHTLTGSLADLFYALALWISVFVGSPIYALWAEKRGHYEKLPSQARPVLFNFLMLFTGKIAWLFFARSLHGLWSTFFAPFGSQYYIATSSSIRMWAIAGIIVMGMEYFSGRRALLAASKLDRKSE